MLSAFEAMTIGVFNIEFLVRQFLCDLQTLASQFEANTKFGGPLLLGLYGAGGIGKTTISKALCDHFRRDYLGKVCHVELGGNSTTLERQKKVLENLCNFDHDVLHKIKDIEEVIQVYFNMQLGFIDFIPLLD